MELIFLGTGPSRAIPRPGCQCPACKAASWPGSKSRRRRSSLLVRADGVRALIDCTPDFLEQAREAGIKKVDAVFLTHRHQDAVGGLALLDRWSKKAVPVYTEEENFFALATSVCERLKFKSLVPGQAVKIGRVEFLPFKVEHGLTPIPTLGFLINHEVTYASDFGKLSLTARRLLKNKSMAIFDAALYFGREMKGHQNVAQAAALARELNIKKLYLTQVGHSYPPYPQASIEIKDFVQKQYPGKLKVALAYDRLKIKI